MLHIDRDRKLEVKRLILDVNYLLATLPPEVAEQSTLAHLEQVVGMQIVTSNTFNYYGVMFEYPSPGITGAFHLLRHRKQKEIMQQRITPMIFRSEIMGVRA